MKSDRGAVSAPDNSINQFRIDELEYALKERDHLVQMLTEQLEQAADQLDRLQRTGSGRGSSGSGLPADLVEEQHTLLGQLTRALEDWERSNASQTLSRIEQQVSEIRGFLEPGSASDSSIRPSKSIADLWSSGNPVSRPAATPAPAAPRAPSPALPANSSWEAIKAAMLSGDPLAETSSLTSSTPSASAASTETEQPIEEIDVAPVADTTPLPPPPQDFDLDAASPEELREAVRSRDDYIAMLVRKLASQPQPRNPDWSQLNQVPDELRQELETLRDHWQSRIRMAEVDLSLQRAKLAREESRIQSQTEAVDRQRKQLGINSDDPTTSNHSAKLVKNASAASRRWMNFLQRPGNGT